ncbi:MAG: sugar phosphate isomerase/epimerase [Clostridia bacterium]|nr:sugar phosphate isomerase/epimerase [Clostridia bacterium]
MENKKLCLGLSGQFGVGIPEQIRLIKEAGFDAFFTGWAHGADIMPCVNAAREYDIPIQSVHAPFNKTDDLWGEDELLAEKGLSELIECVHICEEYSVPIMVSHVFIGFDSDNIPTQVGLERYYKLIREAEKCGVKIGFENTEGIEYLDAIFRNFSGEKSVGFCWDSGHEMCYNHSDDLLAKYGGRLICTHINDNLGIRDYGGKITWLDDLHLLPFDGIADWDCNTNRLKKCGYDSILTFELCKKSKPGRHENDVYDAMPVEVYIAEAYKRACRIAAKMK